MSETYNGTAIDVMIADRTNPWVEVDGVPVDWTKVDLPRHECPCGENGQVLLSGVLDAMDSETGVQRCDACSTYPGDLDAALGLAALVGGIVKFQKEED